MTTYQKLKAENKQLKEDLFNILRRPDSDEGIIARSRHELMYDLNDVVWFGSVSEFENATTKYK